MDLTKVRYKLSQYNVYYEMEDVKYMWNTYSDALFKLDKDTQEFIQSFLGVSDNSNMFDLLKLNGFIVYEQLDEFGRVCLQEKQSLFATDVERTSIIISLGMECNYKCDYCFQSKADRSGVMTPEIAIKVAEYICQRIENNPNAKELRITWFGGEPLLYTNLIEIISLKVMEVVRKNHVSFSANVITNGLLLTAETLNQLQKLCVERVLITLDGTSDLYCRSKGATLENFHSVISNVCNAADKIELSIRLNISNGDVNEAIKITDHLLTECKLLGKIFVYYAHVCRYSSLPEVSLQSYTDYVKNHIQWIDHIVENYGISNIKAIVPKLPQRTITSCGLIKTNSDCIGPSGDLFRCEKCFGDNSKVIGNVWQGRFFNNAEFNYYSTIDMAPKSKCIQCKFTPICMGGCTNDLVTGFVRMVCDEYKRLQIKRKHIEGISNGDRTLLVEATTTSGSFSCRTCRV